MENLKEELENLPEVLKDRYKMFCNLTDTLQEGAKDEVLKMIVLAYKLKNK